MAALPCFRAAGRRPTCSSRFPKGGSWNLDVLTRFVRNARPPVPRDMLIAPLRRRGGAWGAIAAEPAGASRTISITGACWDAIAEAVSEAIHRIDRDRMVGVRDRIDRKIMEQIDPKDLFYQILDGLRSLTQYDHSSAVLIREERRLGAPPRGRTDRLDQSEEPADWTSAADHGRCGGDAAFRAGVRLRSPRRQSGTTGRDNGPPRSPTCSTTTCDEWRRWRKPSRSVDVVRPAGHTGRPGWRAEDCRRGIRDRLKPYDAELVEHFRSQAAVAIQNLHRTESLRARVLSAERKHAMAELARSVSHDVNNALGSMLPLVQQMQEDLRRGALEPTVLREDLEQVQKSLQVCRRIFGGMLSFSRGAARRTRHGQVRRADSTRCPPF